MTVIIVPLIRNRIPMVTPRVTCITTPGSTVDVVVAEYGISVNPARTDLYDRFRYAGLPVKDIHELYDIAVGITGIPRPLTYSGKTIADVLYSDGTRIDAIKRRMFISSS